MPSNYWDAACASQYLDKVPYPHDCNFKTSASSRWPSPEKPKTYLR